VITRSKELFKLCALVALKTFPERNLRWLVRSYYLATHSRASDLCKALHTRQKRSANRQPTIIPAHDSIPIQVRATTLPQSVTHKPLLHKPCKEAQRRNAWARRIRVPGCIAELSPLLYREIGWTHD